MIVADQLLEDLVDIAGRHDLQILPVVGQPDVVSFALGPREGFVSFPAHPPEDDSVVAVEGDERRGRRGVPGNAMVGIDVIVDTMNPFRRLGASSKPRASRSSIAAASTDLMASVRQ